MSSSVSAIAPQDEIVSTRRRRFQRPRRRRRVEEQLARQASRLARRNEALDDFAALVAHELKDALRVGSQERGQPQGIRRALELIDALLEAARTDEGSGTAATDECLRAALRDIGSVSSTIEVSLPAELPLQPTSLRIVLRNLIANGVAAGARTIRIGASRSSEGWSLTVDDDGVGLGGDGGGDYAHGTRLGLALCRRIVERGGGHFELCASPAGGTRALVALRDGGR